MLDGLCSGKSVSQSVGRSVGRPVLRSARGGRGTRTVVDGAVALDLLLVVDDAPQHIDDLCDGGLDIRVELGELVRLQHERVERANLEFGDRERRDDAGVGRDGGPQRGKGVRGVIGGVDGRGEGDEEVGGARHCCGEGGVRAAPVGVSAGAGAGAGWWWAGGLEVRCGAECGRSAGRVAAVTLLAGYRGAWRSSQRWDPVP